MLSNRGNAEMDNATATALMSAVGNAIVPTEEDGDLAFSLRILASRSLPLFAEVAEDIISADTTDLAVWRTALAHLKLTITSYMNDKQIIEQYQRVRLLVSFSSALLPDLPPQQRLGSVLQYAVRAESTMGYGPLDGEADYDKVKAAIIVMAATSDSYLIQSHINEALFIADNLVKVVPHLPVILERGNVYQDFIEELMRNDSLSLESGVL